MPLDPRLWPRDHRIALLISCGLGVFLGLWHSYAQLDPIANAWGMDWGKALARNWLTATFWPVFGAVVGAAPIYVLKLMRN